MKKLLIALAIFLTMNLTPFSVFAESDQLSLFGTLTATALAGIGKNDAGTNGAESELRLVMEGESEDGVLFRAEGGYTYAYVLSSMNALAFDGGVLATPSASDVPSGTDLHRAFFLDQAWASATLGRFSIQAGIIPIGWGTSYLYNPTSRTAAPEFPGENIDVLSGKSGISATVALPSGLSLEGYALASGRISSVVPDVEELDGDTFPFGTKLQLRTDYYDLSLSFQRELSAFGLKPLYWYGADITALAGPVTLYAEGASTRDENEISAGASYTIPFIDTIVRSEYIYIDSGSSDPDAYDTQSFLSGNRVLLAEHYLFAALEKEDPEAARWKVSAEGLLNIDDLSAVLSAEALWIPRLSFELSLFCRWFTGTNTDEFGGTRFIAPGVGFRPYRGNTGFSAKWNF